MTDTQTRHVETVETRGEAMAKQSEYAETLVRLGLTPGATVGYKAVRTVTGEAYEVYVKTEET